MSWLISIILADSSCQAREKSENYKMKNSCPQLYSNKLPLAYKTGTLTNCVTEPFWMYTFIGKLYSITHTLLGIQKVQPKNRNMINSMFHFIIYRDLNVTWFSSLLAFLQYIYIWYNLGSSKWHFVCKYNALNLQALSAILALQADIQ